MHVVAKTGSKVVVGEISRIPGGGVQLATVVYLEDKKNPGRVVGFYKGNPVYPSRLDQNPPTSDCAVRTQDCAPNTAEDSLLFLQHGGRSFIAYPKIGGRTFSLPGTDFPVDIVMQKSISGDDVMIARIPCDDGRSYLTIFPGDNSMLPVSPNPFLAKPWDGKPNEGKTYRCWVHWTGDSGKPIGYAYNHVENGVLYVESFMYLKQGHLRWHDMTRLTIIFEHPQVVKGFRAFPSGDSHLMIAVEMTEASPAVTCQRYAENFYAKGSPAGMISIIPKWSLTTWSFIKAMVVGHELWIELCDTEG